MSRKFLVGVARATGFHIETGDMLLKSKTLIDSSIELTTDSTEVSADTGNALNYIYYHTGRLNLSLTETQFSLNMIAQNVGSQVLVGKNVWKEENVTLGDGGDGSVLGTPLLTPDVGGSDIFGYVTDGKGNTTKVVFTGQDFTLAGGQDGDVVCVQYYHNNNAAKYIDINSNFLPSIIRLVLDVFIASTDEASATGSSIIGKAQVEIPRFQLSGAQSISMTSTGVAQTPLSGMALAFGGAGGCIGTDKYATITEIIEGANWYDGITNLSIQNGDGIELEHPGSQQLKVWAFSTTSGSPAFLAPLSDLTFTSDNTGKVTVGENTGLVETVEADGSANVSVIITDKPEIADSVVVTVLP